ncbi:hypothetical protein ACHQM5_012382 [Ranunculus cassubicifolius]
MSRGYSEAKLGNLSGVALKEFVDRLPRGSLGTLMLLSRSWYDLVLDIVKSKADFKFQPYIDVHTVEEAKHIRSRAITERFLPNRVFDEFKGSNESSGEKGLCQWCRQRYNHISRSDCPAGNLKFYSRENCTRVIETLPRPKTKENALKASVQIYLPGGAEEAYVRKLLEPFGGLQRIRVRNPRHEDFVMGVAIAGFINIDDAERAVETLKKDGYEINWFI